VAKAVLLARSEKTVTMAQTNTNSSDRNIQAACSAKATALRSAKRMRTLLEKVNAAIDAIIKNGAYDRITAKHFKFKLL